MNENSLLFTNENENDLQNHSIEVWFLSATFQVAKSSVHSKNWPVLIFHCCCVYLYEPRLIEFFIINGRFF